ncbi:MULTISPECIES: hypothetical protein [unclassified Microbacterium]|uniref:hypothetical protein n=1 Tax=unclassified Microbacterium TaxID=2609290 RepID=UPI00097F01FC|nr:hypothetical protein [Microbacterium sp. JB110]RCS62870.1 hypothetical protein CIK77_01280 [Microbacterium sp. JB110]SJM61892.1 hypothetical protein CZ774_10965 [Frigoribacterium sp. JB110]
MNTPLSHLSPVEVTERAVCMCAHGGTCSSLAPGHSLHLIQARLASATPTRWADAIVAEIDSVEGTIGLRELTGATRTVWHAGSVDIAEGTPVALHLDYDVLAVGRAQYNVAPLS